MKIVNAMTDALNMAVSLHSSGKSGRWDRQLKLPEFNPGLTSHLIRSDIAGLPKSIGQKLTTIPHRKLADL
jgi:hypothetical protein